MHAFHSNWTQPYFDKYPDKQYEIEDFELLTTIISALKWQEKNGDIEMVTDLRGAAYYRALGLETLWNGGIDTSLEDVNVDIDSRTFWAAGKLFALEKQKAPCVMIDTDFIVWEDVRASLWLHDVVVIHREELDPSVYPNKHYLKVSEEYQYPKTWNFEVLPCNTAFTFFGNDAFKKHYTEEAIRFMTAVRESDPLIYMVFAEQRLLAMCAEEKEIDLYALSTVDDLFHSGQKLFTHVWGHKRHLREVQKARVAFCLRCIERIKKDYPKFYPKLKHIECLRPYL